MKARMSQAPRPLHKRLAFDLSEGQVLDGPRRYLIMRADVLMGAFAKLDPEPRRLALQAMGASVTDHGSDSVRAYLTEVGADALLQTMVTASASLGWGVWSFRRLPDQLWLEVRNSPFAAGTPSSTDPVCTPIVGMLRAVAQALWSEPADVVEWVCACQGQAGVEGICRFQARTRLPKSPSTGPQTL